METTSNDIIAGNGRLFSTEVTFCELNVNYFFPFYFEVLFCIILCQEIVFKFGKLIFFVYFEGPFYPKQPQWANLDV